MPLIYAIGIAVAAQLLIYSGLTFMVGKLLPTLLTPVYDLVPPGNYRFQCHGHIGGKLPISAPIFMATGIKCRNYFGRDGSMHSKYRRFDYRAQIPHRSNGNRIDTRDCGTNHYCLC